MLQKLTAIAVCALITRGVATAQHDHADVEFHPAGVNLVVPPMDHEGEEYFVFPGVFGHEATDPPNFTDHPGFAGAGFNEDDLIGFNVVQELLYWDGAALAPTPADHSVMIENIISDVTVTGDSAPQTGFIFAEADGAGDVHQHIDFTLHGPGEPDGLTPGAYGLWLELTSPEYDVSNDFVIMLNYGLDHEEFEAGVHYVGEHVVPEPGGLALLAALMLVTTRRR